MARPPREFVPGETYHVYARGSNRQAIFSFESDRTDFLDCLDRVVVGSGMRCLGYCLMTNHYHLVIQTLDGDVSRAMKMLNGRYALRFNRRYERDAHVFKNRFGAVRQASDGQLLWTLRYAAMNPVQSGLCESPEQWRWSSYRASAGLERAPRFLDVQRLRSYFGDTSERATLAYQAFVSGIVGV